MDTSKENGYEEEEVFAFHSSSENLATYGKKKRFSRIRSVYRSIKRNMWCFGNGGSKEQKDPSLAYQDIGSSSMADFENDYEVESEALEGLVIIGTNLLKGSQIDVDRQSGKQQCPSNIYLDSGCESDASDTRKALVKKEVTAESSTSQRNITRQSSSTALKPLIIERGPTAWEVPIFSSGAAPAAKLPPLVAPLQALDDILLPEVRHPCRFSRYEKTLPPLRSNPEPMQFRIDRISMTGSTIFNPFGRRLASVSPLQQLKPSQPFREFTEILNMEDRKKELVKKLKAKTFRHETLRRIHLVKLEERLKKKQDRHEENRRRQLEERLTFSRNSKRRGEKVSLRKAAMEANRKRKVTKKKPARHEEIRSEQLEQRLLFSRQGRERGKQATERKLAIEHEHVQKAACRYRSSISRQRQRGRPVVKAH
ncbi:uncharacterized protein [Clytia hemisphaerica]|uniref:Uncharacterized protein n=1 Tax=Clytia hemisphaerica TaxID=252671 RepID=A0A7M6DMV5_9CNID